MYKKVLEGTLIVLEYNFYPITVSYKDSSFVFKREMDGNFHGKAIENFCKELGKTLKIIDIHSYTLICVDLVSMDDSRISHCFNES